MSNKSLREGADIVFADGKTRTVYPLTIKQLRKFMTVIKDLSADTANLTDEDIDRMVEATAIVLSKIEPELSQDKDALEDLVDIRSFNLMLRAAMGTDPND